MRLSAEQIDALKDCSSTEEIIAKAAQAGIELDESAAQQILDDFSFEELDAENLELVSGGCYRYSYLCYFCNDRHKQDEDPHTIFIPGDNSYWVCEECYQAHKNDPDTDWFR